MVGRRRRLGWHGCRRRRRLVSRRRRRRLVGCARGSGGTGCPGNAARPCELGEPSVNHVDGVDREGAGLPLQGVHQRDEQAGVGLLRLVGLGKSRCRRVRRVVPGSRRDHLVLALEQLEECDDLEGVLEVIGRNREFTSPGVLDYPGFRQGALGLGQELGCPRVHLADRRTGGNRLIDDTIDDGVSERRVMSDQARVATPRGVRVALSHHHEVGLVALGLLVLPQLVAASCDERVELRSADVLVVRRDDEVLVNRGYRACARCRCGLGQRRCGSRAGARRRHRGRRGGWRAVALLHHTHVRDSQLGGIEFGSILGVDPPVTLERTDVARCRSALDRVELVLDQRELTAAELTDLGGIAQVKRSDLRCRRRCTTAHEGE